MAKMASKPKPSPFTFETLPPEKVDYYLVLDFEGVCNKDDGGPAANLMEIIEFPVLKVNAKTFETESEFHSYVQPTTHRLLNPICTRITGITQEMVDGQPTLPKVLESLHSWMLTEGLLDKKVNFCFVTCGDWDLKTGLSAQAAYQKFEYPDYLKKWINVKTYFEATVGKKGKGMAGMLRDLGLQLKGRHHSGIDDSRNIARILRELAKNNHNLASGIIEPRTLVR